MPSSFYIKWKYPNTSRRLTKLLFVCLMLYLPVYFLIIAPPKRIVLVNDLTEIHGTISHFEIPDLSDQNKASLGLIEYPSKDFSFSMSGHSETGIIHKGDSVLMFASPTDLKSGSPVVHCYELKIRGTEFFSLTNYNSSVAEASVLAKVFLWIAIIYLTAYLIMEKAGLIGWIRKQLDSPDSKFQPNKPNFNEFLDQ